MNESRDESEGFPWNEWATPCVTRGCPALRVEVLEVEGRVRCRQCRESWSWEQFARAQSDAARLSNFRFACLVLAGFVLLSIAVLLLHECPANPVTP